jgi:hypothetical protein
VPKLRAEIKWVRTAEGHSIPLDKAPIVDGNIELILELRTNGGVRPDQTAACEGYARTLCLCLIPTLYKSHFFSL